jgi:hypothetical protein
MLNSTDILLSEYENPPSKTILSNFLPLFIFITLATFSLNLYIIVIIVINKKLHLPVNLFICSLCFAGIILSCVNMIFQEMLVGNHYNWYLGLKVCILWYIFDYSIGTIILLNLIVVTFMRYMSIVKPHGSWTKKIQILILCFVWMVPFTSWAITVKISFLKLPQLDENCFLVMDSTLEHFSFVFAFFILLIILIAMNIKLIWELRKRSKKVVGYSKNGNMKKVMSPPSVFVTQLDKPDNRINSIKSIYNLSLFDDLL